MQDNYTVVEVVANDALSLSTVHSGLKASHVSVCALRSYYVVLTFGVPSKMCWGGAEPTLTGKIVIVENLQGITSLLPNRDDAAS